MKKYSILFVEDDRQLSELAGLNFLKHQFTFRPCYNGPEALKEVSKERPDIIILDVMMPSMTGWEVLQKLKSQPETSSIPVIICTGRDGREDVEKSFNFGAQAYIIKPIVFANLLKKVAAVLDIEELLHE